MSEDKRKRWNNCVRNEELVVGDIVKLWYGQVRITAIRPYRGPHTDIIFALADTVPGPSGFSLEKGGYTEVV